jgi:ABC-type multidrug transport system fused ATPase/permease subunit
VLIAADYPFLDVFWTMIIFFCWVAWIWVLIVIISDLFRRHDTSGWVKALWVIFLIVLPFLGVLIYLIANGSGMSQRQADSVRASQEQFKDYVQSVAPSGGSASELARAKELLDSGAINQQEYDQLKAKVLA